jgi:hypothetical protein
MNFQGRLADASGTPLHGAYDMTFALYDAPAQGAGTLCFSETYSAATQQVMVNSGLFNVHIGGLDPANGIAGCDFGRPYYLEIAVAGPSGMETMSPRLPITSAAYAFTAQGLVQRGSGNVFEVGNDSTLQTPKIPLSNGQPNPNLNADTVDGKHWDDIAAAVRLDCTLVSGTSTATCPAGYLLTGGGGSCNANNSDNPSFVPDLVNQKYSASCSGANGPTAYAICCRLLH